VTPAAPFRFIFLIGDLLYLFGIYGSSVRGFRKSKIAATRSRPLDIALDMVVFVAWQLLPWVSIFSPWLNFADYRLPVWMGWAGVTLFALSLLLLWKAYRDLGVNWSPKDDIVAGQRLITSGIYAYIRHPIYAGLWLWAFAQPLMLHNWLAGVLLLPTFLILYVVRVPREEKILLEEFGEAYRQYCQHTGRLMPHLSNVRRGKQT